MLLYTTKRVDLSEWDFVGFLSVGNITETGVEDWECPDFYPFSPLVDTTEQESRKQKPTLHASTVSNSTWVLKTSADHLFYDQYALGTYYPSLGTFVPFPSSSPPRKVDFGDLYASKSFWDEEKERRVMWSWFVLIFFLHFFFFFPSHFISSPFPPKGLPKKIAKRGKLKEDGQVSKPSQEK